MIHLSRSRDRSRPTFGRGQRLDPAHHNSPVRSRVVLIATAIVVFAAAVIALRAVRYSERWPLLVVVPSLAGLLISRRERAAWRDRLTRWLNACRTYSQGAGPIPWKPAIVFVGVPFFLLNLAHGTWLGAIDTRPVIPTSVSLVRDGDWNVIELAKSRGGNLLESPDGKLFKCFQALGDGVYSSFPQGMAPFATAVVLPARFVGADLEDRRVHVRLEKLTASLIAASTLVLFYLTALRLGSPATGGIATAFLATGSAVLTTAGLALWQHGGVTTWLLAALLVEFARAGRPDWRGSIGQGIALGSMVACRPTAALLAGLFGLWIAIRSPRRALMVGLVATAAFAPWLALNLSLYGNALGPACVNANAGGQNWDFFRLATMYGVLLCPSRGLFVYQPWAILALGAFVPAVRARSELREGPRGWIAFAAIACLAHIYLIAAWRDWSGGYCWGSRLLTDIVPLVGLLCLPSIATLRQSRVGLAVLAILGILAAATHAPAIFGGAGHWNFVTDHADDLWSWSKAPFLYRP